MKTRSQRERKVVPHYSSGIVKGTELFQGRGIPLGSSKRIKEGIDNLSLDSLVLLHRLMYHKQGEDSERLDDILLFSGFKDIKQREAAIRIAQRVSEDNIKPLCKLFDIENEEKDDMVKELSDFLFAPKLLKRDFKLNYIETMDESEDNEENLRKIEEMLASPEEEEAYTPEEVSEEEDSADDKKTTKKQSIHKKEQNENKVKQNKNKKEQNLTKEKKPYPTISHKKETKKKNKKKAK
ncbi:protein DEK, putative [Entamoeba dispar SAW760]|uniref:Protein DEK, putative n=1 Tax=Entamoeba dispar (strain ATCC PRA-260 / SAW760) TaxID=370354 RepID=B0ES46_ENTDS|nr:protein DEK, putative [Entamoeba dispar SAW760]EDR22655.1 protein DEK, putative [Entamoeba dispar SAW760]|eukprot:EDR22655.1 protein DEK, putative [Entamoeba dispar SAW760]